MGMREIWRLGGASSERFKLVKGKKDFTVGPNQAPADLDFTIKSEVVMGHIEATAQLFAVESGSHVNAASGGPYDMRASGGFTNLRQPNRKASGGSYGAPEGTPPPVNRSHKPSNYMPTSPARPQLSTPKMARTSSNTPSSAERNDPAPPPPEYMSVCPPHHLQAQAAKSDDIPPSPPDYASICPPHHVQASVAAQHSSSAPPLYSSQCPAGHVMGSPSQSMSSPSPSLAVAAPYYPVPTASSSDDSNRSVGDSGGFSQNVKQQHLQHAPPLQYPPHQGRKSPPAYNAGVKHAASALPPPYTGTTAVRKGSGLGRNAENREEDDWGGDDDDY